MIRSYAFRFALWTVALLGATGCQTNKTGILLTLTSTRSVEVDALTVRLTRADQTNTDVTLLAGALTSLPPAREFTVPVSTAQAQEFTVELQARLRGIVVATVMDRVTVTPGARAPLALDLLTQPALARYVGAPGAPGSADGPGGGARFYNPSSLAIAGGNLYIADSSNCTIRQMVLATGVVSTLAGKAGVCGSDDGVGVAARFSAAKGIAADGAGNLFVADSDNHTIRQIVIATGAVTTLAGMPGVADSIDGIGSAAAFFLPSALVADGAGNLLVADTYNNTLRQVVVATGAVTTVAGMAGEIGSDDGTGAAARFNTPGGLALDDAGALYVADTFNDTIRRVTLGTWEVSTLAGTAGVEDDTDGVGPGAHFVAPSGLVYSSGGTLYVTESGGNVIRRITVASAQVSTFSGTAGNSGSRDGGAGMAQFAQPNAVTTDGNGDLLVADTSNNTIRRIAVATAQVTTIAGAASQAGFDDGTLAQARFNQPSDVASDDAGNLFIVDSLNHIIRRIALATGTVSTLAGTAGRAGIADGIGAAAGFRYPAGITADRSGNLYVSDRLNHTIRSIKISTGEVITVAGLARATGTADGNADAARFTAPVGLVLGTAGALYIADTGNNTIRKLVLSSGDVTTLAGTARTAGSDDGTGAAALFAEPTGIAADGNGFLYVTDTFNHTIRRIRESNGEVITLAGTAGQTGIADGTGSAARFNGPSGIVYDGQGGVLVADQNNSTVRRVDVASGVVTTVAGRAGQGSIVDGPGTQGRINSPRGLALLGRGVLAIVCSAENTLVLGTGL